jgi:hypothetical protein
MPPCYAIKDFIHLQHGVVMPNEVSYKTLLLKNEEIKRTKKRFVGQGTHFDLAYHLVNL